MIYGWKLCAYLMEFRLYGDVCDTHLNEKRRHLMRDISINLQQSVIKLLCFKLNSTKFSFIQFKLIHSNKRENLI